MAERLKNCPSKSCLTGIICCEPSEDGLGRLCLCDVCSEEVCGTCGTLWNGRLPILSHRGVRCAMILLIRDSDARGLATASTTGTSEVCPTGATGTAAPVGGGGSGDAEEESLQWQCATFKQCPQCGEGITHYRGHACHHIAPGSGCPSCRRLKLPHPAHFCYVCLGPWPCITPQGQGCDTYCTPACDCPDCPDCRPFSPCRDCSGVAGGCRVCSGDAGGVGEASWLLEKAKARREKISMGWWGPQRAPRTPWGVRGGDHGGRGGPGGHPPPHPTLTSLRTLLSRVAGSARRPLELVQALHDFTVAVTPGSPYQSLHPPSIRSYAIDSLNCLSVFRDVLDPFYAARGGGGKEVRKALPSSPPHPSPHLFHSLRQCWSSMRSWGGCPPTGRGRGGRAPPLLCTGWSAWLPAGCLPPFRASWPRTLCTTPTLGCKGGPWG